MLARLSHEIEGQPVVYELTPDTPATLGRSRDNTIVLRDEHASRLHARIQFENGRWCIRDFGLNGTRVNGERIQQEVGLKHGDEIRIGDTRLRFSTGDTLAPAPGTKRIPVTPPEPPPSTKLQHDDLTILCGFMAESVEETDARILIRKALDIVLHQTSATITGFLSLDPNDPLAKQVLPEAAKVDQTLSKQLTRRIQREGRTVWLGTDLAETHATDSLMPFTDALCIPVKASGQALGALHVYRSNAFFQERDVRFCEALVGYLGSALYALRARRTLEAENSRLRGHMPSADELVGDSPALQQLRQLIARVAPQSFTVLIQGESGVGKELVALALHRQSHRGGGPLVAVNCAAIAPSLLEAELFGYRKGAFSGAERDYPGLFQQADEGTLFLDEVGELSLDCQAKLLRVIEGKAFRPIGSTVEVRTDVRIIAATHRDLEQEVKSGRFRQDLMFRLKVITIEVPPLRAHADDIPFLVQYFLDKLAVECRRQVKLTDAAIQKLTAYRWPGNVRQLRSVLEAAVVMSDGDELDADAFRLPSDVTAGNDLPIQLDELEKWAVLEAIQRTKGNKTQAAKLLGISRDTLATKLERYQVAAAE